LEARAKSTTWIYFVEKYFTTNLSDYKVNITCTSYCFPDILNYDLTFSVKKMFIMLQLKVKTFTSVYQARLIETTVKSICAGILREVKPCCFSYQSFDKAVI